MTLPLSDATRANLAYTRAVRSTSPQSDATRANVAYTRAVRSISPQSDATRANRAYKRAVNFTSRLKLRVTNAVFQMRFVVAGTEGSALSDWVSDVVRCHR